ncbi:hypothetical protein FF2_025014 [Malus domestica]
MLGAGAQLHVIDRSAAIRPVPKTSPSFSSLHRLVFTVGTGFIRPSKRCRALKSLRITCNNSSSRSRSCNTEDHHDFDHIQASLLLSVLRREITTWTAGCFAGFLADVVNFLRKEPTLDPVSNNAPRAVQRHTFHQVMIQPEMAFFHDCSGLTQKGRWRCRRTMVMPLLTITCERRVRMNRGPLRRAWC